VRAHEPGQAAAALEAADGILAMCHRLGGTVSGEDGVGIEERPVMCEPFAPDDLAGMERVRHAFDPDRRLNPGKIIPGDSEPAARGPAQLGGMRAREGAEAPWI